jgi:hypothetical protein
MLPSESRTIARPSLPKHHFNFEQIQRTWLAQRGETRQICLDELKSSLPRWFSNCTGRPGKFFDCSAAVKASVSFHAVLLLWSQV